MWPYSQSSLYLFACIPNLSLAFIWIFNWLLIDKEKWFALLQRLRVISAPIGQAHDIFMGFIPKMKSGSHICISSSSSSPSLYSILWYNTMRYETMQYNMISSGELRVSFVRTWEKTDRVKTVSYGKSIANDVDTRWYIRTLRQHTLTRVILFIRESCGRF